MQKTKDIGQQSRTAALVILGICGLLALLVQGRGFLVPLVIACLLTSLISAGISKLENRGLPSWAAMTVSVTGFFLLVYALSQIFSSQVTVVAETLPKYSARFDDLLAELTAFLGDKHINQIKEAVAKMDVAGRAASVAESVGGIFGTFGLVLMYSAFLLAERGTVLKKLSFLFPDPERAAEVQTVLQSVGYGIRRYVWIKSVVSMMTGGLCYLVLRYVGVDFAEILALMIFLLNFIPTIGSIVGVVLPAIVTLVQFDTLTPFLTVVAVCGGIQFTVGNIIEPRFMGNTLNLSTFIVIVSLTFWGTVWGIEGAFLSVPIAASIVILCRDVPALRPIAILMSADGDLDKGRGTGPPDDGSAEAHGGAKDKRIEDLQQELEALRQDRKG